jgi:hypothetical protein
MNVQFDFLIPSISSPFPLSCFLSGGPSEHDGVTPPPRDMRSPTRFSTRIGASSLVEFSGSTETAHSL